MARMKSEEVLEIFQKVGTHLTETHVVLTPKAHPTIPGKKAWFHSSEYVNKDRLYTQPYELMKLCDELATQLYVEVEESIEVVASPAVGAVVLAFLVANHLQSMTEVESLPAVPVYAEKENGIFVFKRGFAELIPDRRVVVIEDILSSGGSGLGVVEATRKLGGRVMAVGSLWNRGGVTAEKLGGVPRLISLVSSEMPMFLAEEADQCPLCKERIPINKTVGKWREYLEEMAQGTGDFASWCRSQLS